MQTTMKFWQVFIVLTAFILSPARLAAQDVNNDKFVVVLDPGHGGKDPGAVGTGRFKKTEKDVVLAVGKKVRDLLKKHDDIEVIMTRSNDKFLGLRERADIANKNKADVFVSIHCNASTNPQVKGSETYVLGVHRNKDNLEVAKRENAVILLEDDYQIHYEGFDPNAPETFIGLEILQEEFLEQSILLASMLQREYEKRVATKNRSVQQAGFAVLRLTYMPSILTEIGFLSNPKEEKMLHSEEGQNKIAVSIANAIVNYKKIIEQNSVQPETITLAEDGKSGSDQNTSASPAAPAQTTTTSTTRTVKEVPANIFYSVQIKTSRYNLPTTPSKFNGLPGVFKKKMGNVYKYFYGKAYSYEEAKQLLRQAKEKGYSDAFMVGFIDGQRVSVQEVKKYLN